MNTNAMSARNYLDRLVQTVTNLDDRQLDGAIDLIEATWQAGSQIIVLGNGGSSMTALHMVTDWNKSIFMSTGVPFRGRTLVDNVGLLMAYANDVSFADVFVEQLKNILRPKDLVIAISGSGNSENVLKAVEYANENAAVTLGLCGFSGGKLKSLVQHAVHVDVNDMQLAEDVHAIFGHIVMQRLCSWTRAR